MAKSMATTSKRRHKTEEKYLERHRKRRRKTSAFSTSHNDLRDELVEKVKASEPSMAKSPAATSKRRHKMEKKSSERRQQRRRKTSPSSTSPNSPPPTLVTATSYSSEEYEKLREARIKENMETIRQLGIPHLSIQLCSVFKTTGDGAAAVEDIAIHSYGQRRKRIAADVGGGGNDQTPPRRSTRLQKMPLNSPAKTAVNKDANPGMNQEFYTDEHEKLLGTCETSWALVLGSYGKDGARIYDKVNGKLCHQCRQKTIGHHTCCSKCKLLSGQLCGDCLYTRYGENVLEANKNSNWICPVCRDICNCSICRTRKGWAPTGCLYKKVIKLGYQSVAHYLIRTRRPHTSSPNYDFCK